MWSIVAAKVSQRGPYGKEELAKYVREEFFNIPDSVVCSLVMSFRKRCEEAVAASGRVHQK